MTGKLKILHLEDVATDAELVGMALRRSDIVFDRLLVDNKADYIAALQSYKPDIILSDHSLPSFNSIEALHILKETGLNIPFILVTGTTSEEFAVNSIKEGASDYVLKDRMQRLPNAVLNAMEKYHLDADRQKANEELNLLFNTIDEVFFSFDVISNGLIQISPACEKTYGYTTTELLDNPGLLIEIMHPDDRYLQAENNKKLALGETIISQYRIIHKDGGVRWLESKIIPGTNKEGQLIRLYGVTRDITERKKNEVQLQKNNIQLKEASETQAAILNALPPNIVLLNESGKIMAVNQSWKRFAIFNNLGIPNYGMGYNYIAIAEKATGIDRVTAQKLAKGIKNVIAGTAKEFSIEYSYQPPNDQKWFRVMVSPLMDHTRKGAVILHTNITDSKLAEASVLQSEANLRSVFENTDLAIVLFDNSLKIISCNNNSSDLAIKHFGKKIKNGHTAFNYFPKERASFIKKIAAQVNNKEMVCYETTYGSKDGAINWYDVKWVGVQNKKMENIGIILTLKNITDKKNADLERDKITADLLQRNNDLEQFTYIISHNLRAPVANIQGLSNLLTDTGPHDSEKAEALKSLSISVNNLDKVIIDLNDILQVRNEANQQIEIISLPLLVEEIRAGINQMIIKNAVQLTYNFDQLNELRSLKSYLYSIFQNLIVNSIKYRRANVEPVITITSTIAGNKVYIYFTDNGKGIDLERYSSHLFGLYKRFDWSVEGKGMGLFMVKMQVERLGGTISVESELNKGTEFKLEFPLVN
jgi:PAS domain S-box-containing protein